VVNLNYRAATTIAEVSGPTDQKMVHEVSRVLFGSFDDESRQVVLDLREAVITNPVALHELLDLLGAATRRPTVLITERLSARLLLRRMHTTTGIRVVANVEEALVPSAGELVAPAAPEGPLPVLAG